MREVDNVSEDNSRVPVQVAEVCMYSTWEYSNSNPRAFSVPMTSIGYVPSSAWQSDISMRRRIRYEHDAPRTMYDKIWDDHVVARLDDGTLWLASHWAHAGLDIDSIAI